MEEEKVISSSIQTQHIFNVQLPSLTSKKCLLYFNSTFYLVQILNISYITSVYQDILGVGGVGVGAGERVGITPTMNLDEKWMKGDNRRETALLIPSPMLSEKEESSKFKISIS